MRVSQLIEQLQALNTPDAYVVLEHAHAPRLGIHRAACPMMSITTGKLDSDRQDFEFSPEKGASGVDAVCLSVSMNPA